MTLIIFKRINRPYNIYILFERYNFVQAICTIFEITQLHKNAKGCAEAWRLCIKIHVHYNKRIYSHTNILAWLSYCSTYRFEFSKPIKVVAVCVVWRKFCLCHMTQRCKPPILTSGRKCPWRQISINCVM